jgi:protein involved in polysaccharide export with SLBB domain
MTVDDHSIIREFATSVGSKRSIPGQTKRRHAPHQVILRVLVSLLQATVLSVAVFGGPNSGVGHPRNPPGRPSQTAGQQDSSSNNVSRNNGASPAANAEHSLGSGAIVASGEDYRIGPTDVIELHVEDAPELSRTFTVGADGTFQMPYLRQVSAAQRTTQQLEKIIVDGLKGKYLIDPHVTVTVLRFNSRSYFIEGAVHSPGLYIVQGRPSLMQLITIAGGFADNHGSTAFIIRQIKASPKVEPTVAVGNLPSATTTDSGGGQSQTVPVTGQTGLATDQTEPEKAKYELIKANINGLFRGEFEQDKAVEPGDIINIPPTDVFFVSGEVKKAGSFSLKEGTTLRQAISMAEGTTFKAAVHRAVIFRDNPKTGKREEITVDVGKVMAGKEEDMPILANDVIEIPNSRSKTAFGALLTGLGASAMRAPIP